MKVSQLVIAGSLASAFLMTSCGVQDSNASLKVTNGAEIAEQDYSNVVQTFKIQWNEDRSEVVSAFSCTATWITKQVLLTAAHCIGYGDSVDSYGRVSLPESEMILIAYTDEEGQLVPVTRGLNFYIHPNWGGGVDSYDLGLIVFPPKRGPVAAQEPSEDYPEGRPALPAERDRPITEMTARAPYRGEEVVMVGYGLNDIRNNTGSGIKRLGTNTIDSASYGRINLSGVVSAGTGSAEDSTLGSGDSGGPLFRAADGVQIGVASGNQPWSGRSIYVDLASSSSQRFIATRLADIDRLIEEAKVDAANSPQ